MNCTSTRESKTSRKRMGGWTVQYIPGLAEGLWHWQFRRRLIKKLDSQAGVRGRLLKRNDIHQKEIRRERERESAGNTYHGKPPRAGQAEAWGPSGLGLGPLLFLTRVNDLQDEMKFILTYVC